MKRTIIGLAALAVALTGCSVSVNSKPDAPAPSPSSSVSTEDLLWTDIQAAGLDSYGKDRAITLAHAACQGLDSQDPLTVGTSLYVAGMTAGDAGKMLVVVTDNLCPDHRDAVVAFASTAP